MSFNSRLIGKIYFWLVFFAALSSIPALFLPEGGWLGEIILSSLLKVSVFSLWISAIVFLPMSFFKKTRLLAATGLECVSLTFALNFWFMAMELTYMLVGPVMTAIGLLFLGMGCIPFSFFITWYFSRWIDLEILIVLLILTVATRILSSYLMSRGLEKGEE